MKSSGPSSAAIFYAYLLVTASSPVTPLFNARGAINHLTYWDIGIILSHDD